MGEEVRAAVKGVVVAAAEDMEDVAKKGELVRKSFKTFKSKKFEGTRIVCNAVDVRDRGK